MESLKIRATSCFKLTRSLCTCFFESTVQNSVFWSTCCPLIYVKSRTFYVKKTPGYHNSRQSPASLSTALMVLSSGKQESFKYPTKGSKKAIACKLILRFLWYLQKNMGGYKHSLSIWMKGCPCWHAVKGGRCWAFSGGFNCNSALNSNMNQISSFKTEFIWLLHWASR